MRKVHEPSSRRILEGHGKPVGHHTLISTRGLNGDDVELEELDWVGGPIITRADVWPEFVGLDHVALLASKSEEPGVVDELLGDLDVLASFANVVEGAVMIFSAALKGDACVFWRALDDLAVGLSTRRRCRTGNCPLGLSGLSISSDRDVVPRHRIWLPRTLGTSQGRVFIGDGDELGDSSAPPLMPVRSGLIAQQLLRHGESLRKSKLTPRTSTRFSGGGEGERWCGVDIDDRPVGNPKRRYDEHSSKSSLSCETKVYRTSRRKNQTMMLASFMTLWTRAPDKLLVNLTGSNVKTAHNTTKKFSPNLR
jgi:hypothetical protein